MQAEGFDLVPHRQREFQLHRMVENSLTWKDNCLYCILKNSTFSELSVQYSLRLVKLE